MKNKTIQLLGRNNLPKQLFNFGRHLVYSEGTKTEPYFVESIKKAIASKYNVRPNQIIIVNANHKASLNTIGLANFAINDVNKRIKDNEQIDHVWVFFDKDDFPESDFKNAHKKLESKNNGLNYEGIPCDSQTDICWHSLPSNECFELLLLLYFNFEQSSLSRKIYPQKINEYVQKVLPDFKYYKNLKNIHQIIINVGGSYKNAINFGKKLERKNHINNPSTLAYKFLEYFASYFD